MTLITFPTRVHFADDVMEEALHSELERAGLSRVLLICDAGLIDTEFYDRVRAGLPRREPPMLFHISQSAALSDLANHIGDDPDFLATEAIIAFGSMRGVELGRKARRKLFLAHGGRVPLYAIPGVDGLPDPCMRDIESWRNGLPSVVILDPTLILTATPEQTMRSVVRSLVRCIESYLSAAYNPPADGMALDGFSRCVTTLPNLRAVAEIDGQREVMAAGLNATMAQEKGLGPAQALAAALAQHCSTVNTIDAARLILPGVVAATLQDSRKSAVLATMLGPLKGQLDVALQRFLANLPMMPRLSDMGVTAEHVRAALHTVGDRPDLSRSAAGAILETVF